MQLRLEQTNSFKKSLKKYKHQKIVLKKLDEVVRMLVNDEVLPESYRDHKLSGDFRGIMELHIKPDVLLLYKKISDQKIILLAVGSHSDLF